MPPTQLTMIAIDNVLISDEVITQKFVCNLQACKGACCWEGDYGAPVNQEEISNISSYNDVIAGFLPQESKAVLSEGNGFVFYEEAESWGTALHQSGACVYLTKDENGIALCGIELCHKAGLIPHNKPTSCHMYPIRVIKNEFGNFEAWNYDEWDICSAACSLGDSLKVPVIQFLKEAIVRYKGEEFYDQLENAARDLYK